MTSAYRRFDTNFQCIDRSSSMKIASFRTEKEIASDNIRFSILLSFPFEWKMLLWFSLRLFLLFIRWSLQNFMYNECFLEGLFRRVLIICHSKGVKAILYADNHFRIIWEIYQIFPLYFNSLTLFTIKISANWWCCSLDFSLSSR